MARIARLIPAVALALVLVMPRVGSAQTIYTSFGIGDTYNTGSQLSIFSVASSGNFAASAFGYVGAGAQVSAIRFAGQDHGDPLPLFVSFLDGGTSAIPTLTGAATLESWSVPGNASADGIYTLTSLNTPTLVTGHTYWLELSVAPYPPNDYFWGWNYATNGTAATTAKTTAPGTGAGLGTAWDYCSGGPGVSCTALAWDVSANGQGTTLAVTPEPGTMTLLAFGLVGMAGMRRRKRTS